MDPKIGAWLLDPEFNKEKSLSQLVGEFGTRTGEGLYAAPVTIQHGLSFKVKTKASPAERCYLRVCCCSAPLQRNIVSDSLMIGPPVLAFDGDGGRGTAQGQKSIGFVRAGRNAHPRHSFGDGVLWCGIRQRPAAKL